MSPIGVFGTGATGQPIDRDGLSRFRLPGSAHRCTMFATARHRARQPALPHGGIGPAELDPAQGPATRSGPSGRTKRAVAGPRLPRAERFGSTRSTPCSQAATLISGAANRWEYEWSEVEFTGPGTYTKKGRTSATLGLAYNRAEMGNTASGAARRRQCFQPARDVREEADR